MPCTRQARDGVRYIQDMKVMRVIYCTFVATILLATSGEGAEAIAKKEKSVFQEDLNFEH